MWNRLQEVEIALTIERSNVNLNQLRVTILRFHYSTKTTYLQILSDTGFNTLVLINTLVARAENYKQNSSRDQIPRDP